MNKIEKLINKYYGTVGVSIRATVEAMEDESDSMQDMSYEIYKLLTYLNKEVKE